MSSSARFLAASLWLIFTGHLTAGTTAKAGSTEMEAPAGPPGWLAVMPSYTHQFETDVDNGFGSFSADRWRLDAGTRLPLSEDLSLAIGIETEWSRYDFRGAASHEFRLNDDLEDVFLAQLAGLAVYDLNDTWQLQVAGTLSWGGDFGASFSDGLGGGGLFGVTYRFSPSFSLSPGVLALSRLEDDALIVPVLGLDWQISDDWRLRSIGPGGELIWQLNEEWTWFFRARYRPRDYRLAPDAEVPSGVWRERSFPLSMGVEWAPSARVTASIFGGAVVGGSVRLIEEEGREILEEDYDPVPILGASLRIMF